MKLLIVTQKVDRTDPILGFFHRWLREFSGHGQITVIGQKVGEYDLPGVTVLSLGKERGHAKAGQILRFWTLLWRHRKECDAVLVHMTPVWVVLGAPLFWVLRKRVYLWYEARGGGMWLRIAALIARRIFSASKAGMPFATSNNSVVGHGIDTVYFRPSDQPRDEHLLVTVGRITASKRLDIMLDALSDLPSEHLDIIGVPLTDSDRALLGTLQTTINRLHLKSRVTIRALSPAEIPMLLQRAAVFLHASETALDKALLEAMACACPVVSCAGIASNLLPEICRATPENFGLRITEMMALPSARRAEIGDALRNIVEKEHGLARLIERLMTEMAEE